MAERGVTEVLFGLRRAAEAVDGVLADIERALKTGNLPQAQRLAPVARFRVTDAALDYARALFEDAQDEVESLDAESNPDDFNLARTALASQIVLLEKLEVALVELRRAIYWASRYSGFNWWLTRRQDELLIANYIVIPAPASSSTFKIQVESSLKEHMTKLDLVDDNEALDLAEQIRLLYLPQRDGGDVKWHPISLGHELAHLIFNQEWVTGWLAEISDEHLSEAGEYKDLEVAGRTAIARARIKSTERWFRELVFWLSEVACDATATRIYGEGAIDSLRCYLLTNSQDLEEDGVEHPSALLRLAVLRAAESERVLTPAKSEREFTLTEETRRGAFCQLALFCRQKVLAQLSTLAVDQSIRDGLRRAIRDGDPSLPPASNHWDDQALLSSPSTIESALVGALWPLPGAVGDGGSAEPDWDLLRLNHQHVEHAVDFLQFRHRFEVARSRVQSSVSVGPRDRPPNLLSLTREGVFPCAAVQDDYGREEGVGGFPSFDLRLGRHFIVFKRNLIATLNTLDVDQETRQLQDAIEIGWGDTFVLHPHEMVLAVTLEFLTLSHDVSAQVLSRSSIGRMGLLSATAVHVQPGFRGCLTLELVNLASVPLNLRPGQRIAQVVPAIACGEDRYSGKYQNQDGRPRFTAVSQDWEMSILGEL